MLCSVGRKVCECLFVSTSQESVLHHQELDQPSCQSLSPGEDSFRSVTLHGLPVLPPTKNMDSYTSLLFDPDGCEPALHGFARRCALVRRDVVTYAKAGGATAILLSGAFVLL